MSSRTMRRARAPSAFRQISPCRRPWCESSSRRESRKSRISVGKLKRPKPQPEGASQSLESDCFRAKGGYTDCRIDVEPCPPAAVIPRREDLPVPAGQCGRANFTPSLLLDGGRLMLENLFRP